ncbi:hypothetical protein evm_012938 [Chilo suppressalis]|nr:hypothetical protein evm_012938 [Chilo suppressalis]
MNVYSIQSFVPTELRNKSEEELFAEQFPVNVTPLMNEDQLWGCFYIVPEIYADIYSPTVRIRKIEDVPDLVGGVLTRDMVTACLSYLKRTPILGDFVYIKLNLAAKHLINIDVLQHYKYIVYLDISSNLLTELTVLSHLLYLQFLSVAFNRLSNVLEYDTPQWFLTEVHYKFNSVKKIRDLSMFWSITILDLSHNNIKNISGLENLRYLRRLDLSFNHIQRLENLNNLHLLWLDVSYNNISSFEISATTGLWTLLYLEYLNLNENNLTSMKIFSGCTRLRELHARNNRLCMLLELAVYMRQMRRLIVMDLRANPVCSTPGYNEVVINTFPLLLSLDAQELDPVIQRSYKMEKTPDIHTFATRRLLRLLYIEQLSRARVPSNVPPADTTDIGLVVLVGYECVGKGTLARRLAQCCPSNVELGCLHTTATYHALNRYKEVSRIKFDDMLLAGEFLSYSEMDGESYGLSREEAFVNEGKVKIVCMDLIGALMLALRGLRPYLILVTKLDKVSLELKQKKRRSERNLANQQRMSLETPLERSTLQVLLSGRIIITGILNEILYFLPEEKEKSEFVMESECSLMMDSEARKATNNYNRGYNLLTLLAPSTTSIEESAHRPQEQSQVESSLYSLYKESQGTDAEYNSYGQSSYQESRNQTNAKHNDRRQSKGGPKSVDFSRYTSSTWKGYSVLPDGSKSSKSVTFTSQDNVGHVDTTGKAAEPKQPAEKGSGKIDDPRAPNKMKTGRSISTKVTGLKDGGRFATTGNSSDDLDLWLAFLMETGLLRASSFRQISDVAVRKDTRVDDPDAIIRQLADYQMEPGETSTTNVRDDYEDIHRKYPGIFWDTVATDNADEAYTKLKHIIQNIINFQPRLKPMFDIDFVNLPCYSTVESRLDNISKQIAPQRLFN